MALSRVIGIAILKEFDIQRAKEKDAQGFIKTKTTHFLDRVTAFRRAQECGQRICGAPARKRGFMVMWERTKKKKPSYEYDILFTIGNANVTLGYYMNNKFYSYETPEAAGIPEEEIKFWMRVPEPPKENENDDPNKMR